MDHPIVVIAGYAAIGILLYHALLLVIAKGNISRAVLAYRVQLRTLVSPILAEKVRPLVEPVEQKPVRPKPSGEPLRLLAVLQRDSRFLDFFMDDIQAAADDQIVAFVKDMHPKCQASLRDHLVLEPVMNQTEGDSVEVAAGFDPSAVRLLGNVTGQPPFHGTLQHRGWHVKEIKLAPPPAGQDEFVVQPAEVYLA
jgi:hypothetical protein